MTESAAAVARRELRVRPPLLYAAVALWSTFYLLIALHGGAGFDSHAYWLTRDGIHYATDPGKQDAYLYSPAFAHAIRPLTLLPWPAFALLWAGLAAATFIWFARAAERRWQIAVFALCLGDVVYGNVWWIFALVVAFGLRRPALWAIPLLLKVTPAVGLIWFAVRREWRNLAIAVILALGVAAVSYAVDPQAWRDWVGFLQTGHESWLPNQTIPLATRIAAAFALTGYAARKNRPTLLPAAVWLATPMFSLNGVAIFAVLPYLQRRRAQVSAP
ncbi:MAG: glycosyltransferase 87 family protein [Gaiellaceae bacterium]